MNNQFFGDERDFYKYALLRVLSDGGNNSIGVCWLLTEGCTSGGGELDYLRRDSYKAKDPELFCFLRNCICEKKIRNVSVMDDKIIPGAKYFLRPFPAVGRDDYFQQAAKELGGCDFLFLDPDTGFGYAKNRPNIEKWNEYVWWHEVKYLLSETKKSILVFQYFRLPFYTKDGSPTSIVGSHRRIVENLSQIAGGDTTIKVIWKKPVAFYFMLRKEHEKIFHHKMEKITELGFSDPIQ